MKKKCLFLLTCKYGGHLVYKLTKPDYRKQERRQSPIMSRVRHPTERDGRRWSMIAGHGPAALQLECLVFLRHTHIAVLAVHSVLNAAPVQPPNVTDRAAPQMPLPGSANEGQQVGVEDAFAGRSDLGAQGDEVTRFLGAVPLDAEAGTGGKARCG
ncbi:MAG TPA: hypothetical protein PLU47_10255 [Azonexus sp.]|nr:hypothetical protein [Azonexus sp.]